MKEGQEAIYYATGASRELVKQSPHLEQLAKRGFEVLLMFDAVDPFALDNLTEYDGKKLKNVMAADLDLGEQRSDKDGTAEPPKQASQKLIDKFKSVLAEQVGEVKTSTRLEDSPACLVTPEGGLAPHIERMLRARNQGLPGSKRILEVNAKHPLIQKLESLCEADDPNDAVSDWVRLVHDQALLAEGSPIEDPAQFAKRLTTLMTRAAAAET
jgi:molecular chaperone HtpG